MIKTCSLFSASDSQFKEGVRNLAKVLDIPLHEDDKVTLEAVVLLVEERLSEKGLSDYKEKSAKVILMELCVVCGPSSIVFDCSKFFGKFYDYSSIK